MAKRETLGLMVCPECGQADAEIKAQKNGRLYRWCGLGCNAQFFARTAEQEAAMRKHLDKGQDKPAAAPVLARDSAAPVTVTAPAPAPRAEPAPVLPAKKGTGNALLDYMQEGR